MGYLLVIMGVSGAGKTTLSRALAERTGWPLIEGDDYHPPENVAKQSGGKPLDNRDRLAWLQSIAAAVRATSTDTPVLLACSALNSFVRGYLVDYVARPVRWIWLDPPRHILEARLDARSNHFMPPSLLTSQIDALEPPEDVLRIGGNPSLDNACEQVLAWVSLTI